MAKPKAKLQEASMFTHGVMADALRNFQDNGTPVTWFEFGDVVFQVVLKRIGDLSVPSASEVRMARKAMGEGK